MKTRILLSCLLAVLALKTYANDLLVEEFGLAPAYNSISAAVAAAADGDRIIIKNRNGNAPWVEHVNIDKSVQLLPFSNDTFFVVQGNFTIIPADNREITIIGMRNTTGNIASTVAANVSARTKVNIMGSLLQNGNISFGLNGFNCNIIHTRLNSGTISIRQGNVIGCDIITTLAAATSISITAETVVTNEIVRIIGNKISNLTPSGTGINFGTNTHLADIRNNAIWMRNIGIAITRTKTPDLISNKIINNTISVNGAPTSANVYAIQITATSANSIVDVINNLVDISSTTTANVFGISNASGVISVNAIYNTVDDSVVVARQIAGTYTTNSNNIVMPVSIDADGRALGAAGVNAGNPAVAYYDLDLTVNDCGAYGGSFTLDNYFPIHAGAARVYMVTVPANVRVGGTINIQADGYDR